MLLELERNGKHFGLAAQLSGDAVGCKPHPVLLGRAKGRAKSSRRVQELAQIRLREDVVIRKCMALEDPPSKPLDETEEALRGTDPAEGDQGPATNPARFADGPCCRFQNRSAKPSI